jgi:hypothetical protein
MGEKTMQAAVRLYGTHPDIAKLVAILRETLGGVVISTGTYEDDVQDPKVNQCDILICFVQKEDNDAATTFLARAIKYHGAYIYLTTIVIGEIESSHEDKLYLLGAARYLQSGTDPSAIAQEAERTLQKTWWYGMRQLNVAAIIVDEKQCIIRANDFANQQFERPLVGNRYEDAVEHARAEELSRDHPLVKARRETRAAVGDRLLPTKRGHQRFYLLCSPLHSVGKRPCCTTVLMIEMSRSEEIIRASTALAAANSLEELCPLIALQVIALGMQRVRVYEYIPATESLVLRAAEGYSPREKEKLLDPQAPFRFSIEDDGPSQNTMQRTLPRLWVRSDVPREGSDFECYFTGQPRFKEELGKETVNRWIEAPLLLPPMGDSSAARFWGKLSIDRGPINSDHLSGRDVDDVVLLSILIVNALAATYRLESERTDRGIIRHASAQVVSAISRSQPLDQVLAVVLEMFRRITHADLVIYREYDESAFEALRIVGVPQPSDRGALVPRDLPSDIVAALFGFLGQRVSDDLRPTIVDDPHGWWQKVIGTGKESITDAQRDYLDAIRSELHIPIVRQEIVQGVIIALSDRAKGFTPDAVSACERLIYVASSWIELAKQESGKLWVDEALTAGIRSLPLLADIPLADDRNFFAGLAAILTSHLGLRWNRIIAFACNDSAARKATLVYALGGRVDKQDEHKALQQRVTEDARFTSLESFVSHTLKNADLLRNSDPTGDLYLRDSLYDLCISNAKESHYEYYGDQIADCDAHNHPIQWLLAPVDDEPDNERTATRLLEIRHKNGLVSPWISKMNSQYVGMFNQDRKVYGFSLWSVCNQFQEPLGVVLLDTQHPINGVSRESMISATHVLLGLAADVLATRRMSRRLGGLNRALSALFHGRDLKMVWAEFAWSFGEMGLNQAGSMRLPGTMAHRDQLAATSTLLSEMVGKTSPEADLNKRIMKAFREVQEKIHRIYDDPLEQITIPDLQVFLANLGERPGELRIHVDAKAVSRVELACDPIVLDDALRTLIANSERLGKGRDDLCIEIVATLEEGLSSGNFERFVSIVIRDNGPGISPSIARYLGIKGVTSQKDALHHGQGIAIARGLLIDFHGKLDYAGPGYPDAPPGRQGAAFEIIFGVGTRGRSAPTLITLL